MFTFRELYDTVTYIFLSLVTITMPVFCIITIIAEHQLILSYRYVLINVIITEISRIITFIGYKKNYIIDLYIGLPIFYMSSTWLLYNGIFDKDCRIYYAPYTFIYNTLYMEGITYTILQSGVVIKLLLNEHESLKLRLRTRELELTNFEKRIKQREAAVLYKEALYEEKVERIQIMIDELHNNDLRNGLHNELRNELHNELYNNNEGEEGF